MPRRLTPTTRALLGASLLLGFSASLQASPSEGQGAVFTLSNAAAGNEVLAYRRAEDGSLAPTGSFPTGGLGTGANLGSQGALTLSGDGRWLFAVNAGSSTISSFAVHPQGLVLAGTSPSGGTTPVSVTVRGHLLYVLNQGGSGNIAGFWVGSSGELTPVPGSARPLSSASAGAAEIAFSPDQERLVVTEKSTNLIDTYEAVGQGLFSGPTAHPSNGNVPFGFTFTHRDSLLVTEAGSNAVSSYDLDGNRLDTVSASVPSQGAAPCWIATTRDGRFAFSTNAHVGSIAGFRIDEGGRLSFIGLTVTASVPVLDVAAAPHSLYVLAAGTHELLAYRVASDGSLTPVTGAAGLPVTAVGLAVR